VRNDCITHRYTSQRGGTEKFSLAVGAREVYVHDDFTIHCASEDEHIWQKIMYTKMVEQNEGKNLFNYTHPAEIFPKPQMKPRMRSI
jgi:hypothetical protein